MKKITLIFISIALILFFAREIKGEEIPKFGCELVETNKCSGNGECLEDGNCFCNEGYIGETCETSNVLFFNFFRS